LGRVSFEITMNARDVSADSPGWKRVVFSCEGDQFTVRDIIQAARWRGELEAFTSELRVSLACVERAAELELEPDQEQVQRLSEEFRYERDLLTTEETERWLERHDVNEEDFNDFFLRRYWRVNLTEADFPEPKAKADHNEEFAELLRVELMLSGEFERLERELTSRVAALHSEGQKRESKADLEARGALGEWWSRAEAAYRDVCGRVLTLESRARMLAAMRILLTRVVVESVVLKSETAAREAALCLRDRELTMEDLSKECGCDCARVEIFLGDCEEEQQRRFLCAAPGEILEPQPCEGGMAVSRLVNKIEPGIADEAIRLKIDARLLGAHLSELASKVITRAQPVQGMA